MAGIFNWSSTASSNTAVDGVNVQTGMGPGFVDDALRAIMGVVRSSFSSVLETFLNGTAALGIGSGGTGATTASAALTALGGLAVGYRDLQLVTKTAAFAFADAERGGRIAYTGATAAATISPNATTAITDGAVYVIRNGGTGVLTITRGAGVVLKVNGSTVSADAAIAIGGVASLIRWAADDWSVTGAGIS